MYCILCQHRLVTAKSGTVNPLSLWGVGASVAAWWAKPSCTSFLWKKQGYMRMLWSATHCHCVTKTERQAWLVWLLLPGSKVIEWVTTRVCPRVLLNFTAFNIFFPPHVFNYFQPFIVRIALGKTMVGKGLLCVMLSYVGLSLPERLVS